ncbi:hypothetical protein D6745_02545 [Candidatus Woesearchaeota archaeon]|nr:MAG: hypothetical protein D6745_02545 [Candidatus Woesearchaeota archaeon]
MNKILILLIALGLIIVGCTQGGQQVGDTTNPFIGGTQGLDIGFLEGSPPGIVFDQGQFPFGVQVVLENVGEWDINAGEAKVTLVGVDPEDFGRTGEQTVIVNEDIPGQEFDPDLNVIPGGISFVDMGEWNYAGNVSGQTQFFFRADICYQYGLMSEAFLCIKDDLLDTQETASGTKIVEPVCFVNEQKTVYNSGSPIQVASLTESAQGNDKIAFTFELQHRNVGLISRLGTECSDTIQDEDTIYVEVDTGLSGTLDCNGLDGPNEAGRDSGEVKLFNGHRIIRCVQQLSMPINSEFKKLVTIKAEFDYKDHVTTPVLVKHAG